MERLSKDTILEYNPDTLEKVRKLYGFNNADEINKAIDTFDEWVKKQNHFIKKDFERHHLERLIITSKGSVERAKERLDQLCTMRTMMPQFFENFNPKEDFKMLDNSAINFFLPKLTANNERILLVKNFGSNFNASVVLNSFKTLAMLMEYLKCHDYAQSYRCVWDTREANMASLIASMSRHIIEFHNVMSLIIEGYGVRISGIHMLTDSKIVDGLVAILKRVTSAKIGDRIYAHKDLESLFEVLQKDIFPIEYSGKERPYKELYEKWTDILSSEDFRQLWRDMNKARTNESYRQSDKFNDRYMGMPGTFRSLSVD